MPYTAQINRANPACILLLIDQSKSMGERFAGTRHQSKATVVADAVNRLLQNLVLRSAKAGGVRDYFRIGVIGYGKTVRAGLGQRLSDPLVPISQMSDHPLRLETRTKLIPDGTGGVVEQTVKFPVWFDPEADGKTPMCEALEHATLAAKTFTEAFPHAFPPIVLNLTDGKPTDGNPEGQAFLLKTRRTLDGGALLFNLLLSSQPVPPTFFPDSDDPLPDGYGKTLFQMSSVLPDKLREAAQAEGFEAPPGARGVVINADPTAIVRFLDIGTRVTPAGQ